MTTVCNQDLLDEHWNELLDTPINFWRDRVFDWTQNNMARLRQNGPIPGYFKELVAQNWPMGKQKLNKLSKGPGILMEDALKHVEIKPDNMQYSLASYAVGSIDKHPLQLWEVDAGMGKSRIIHAAAMFALLEARIEHIHIVYPNKELMERD